MVAQQLFLTRKARTNWRIKPIIMRYDCSRMRFVPGIIGRVVSNRDINRRSFVRTIGATGACIITSSLLLSCEYSPNQTEDYFGTVGSQEIGSSDLSPDVTQYGFLVNPQLCTACGECIEACRVGNQLSADTQDRRKITSITINQSTLNVSTTCMHCADPSCETVCPTQAISKGEGGIVSVDKTKCIGCKYCYQACPYQVPTYNKQSMDKCDCCKDVGLPLGEQPFCVKACIYGALRFGTLEELRELEHGKARPIAESNNPSCLIV